MLLRLDNTTHPRCLASKKFRRRLSEVHSPKSKCCDEPRDRELEMETHLHALVLRVGLFQFVPKLDVEQVLLVHLLCSQPPLIRIC